MDRISKLYRRIDALEEEVRQLKAERWPPIAEWRPVERRLTLAPKPAQLMTRLMKAAPEVVTRAQLLHGLELAEDIGQIDCFVSQSRAALRYHQIDADIETIDGVGFRMSLNARDAVLAAIDAQEAA